MKTIILIALCLTLVAVAKANPEMNFISRGFVEELTEEQVASPS
jgi:hypothetical protein